MRTIFAFAAATLLSTTAGALATTSDTITIQKGSATCTTVLTFSNDAGLGVTKNVLVATSSNDVCTGNVQNNGQGFVATISPSAGVKHTVAVIGASNNGFDYIITFSLPMPAVGGTGQYGVWNSSNGSSLTVVASGNYTRTK